MRFWRRLIAFPNSSNPLKKYLNFTHSANEEPLQQPNGDSGLGEEQKAAPVEEVKGSDAEGDEEVIDTSSNRPEERSAFDDEDHQEAPRLDNQSGVDLLDIAKKLRSKEIQMYLTIEHRYTNLTTPGKAKFHKIFNYLHSDGTKDHFLMKRKEKEEIEDEIVQKDNEIYSHLKILEDKNQEVYNRVSYSSA